MNSASWIVLCVIVLYFVFLVRYMIKNKRKGGACVGCSCCGSAGCHGNCCEGKDSFLADLSSPEGKVNKTGSFLSE